MKPNRNHTIDEIAAAAGVSKATVSRVINGTVKVSDEKRIKVEATIKKMGFHPNPNARKLAGGVGRAIALVLEEDADELFANAFWRSVIRGFIERASTEHLHPVLFFHSKSEPDSVLVEALVRGNYDAVAIFGWHRNIRLFERSIPENMVVVFGGNQGNSKRFTYIGADNVEGGRMATQHLIQMGCRRIITITGDLTVQSARERLEGYKEALLKAGLPYKESRVLPGNYGKEKAESAMLAYLKKGVAFDGIFAANDLTAVAALKVLKEAKIKVPQEVKLIGFDGTEDAAKSIPSISTIAQPSYELGSNVARNLILALARKELVNERLELHLVRGDSTRAS